MGLAAFPLSQSFYQAVKSALVLEMDLELMCCGADSNKALFTGSCTTHWKSLGAGDLRLWGCSGENQWHPESPRLHTEDKPPTSSPPLVARSTSSSFFSPCSLFIVGGFSGKTCIWRTVAGKKKRMLSGMAGDDFWCFPPILWSFVLLQRILVDYIVQLEMEEWQRMSKNKVITHHLMKLFIH